MPAVPEALYAILALNKLGANANMLNPTFSAGQLTDRINETKASLMLIVNELYPTIRDVIPKTTIKTVIACPAVNCMGCATKLIKKARKIPGTVDWNDFIRQGKNTVYQAAPYRPNYPAITVYSSGTTGASKGIQLSNNSINATITQYEKGGYNFIRQDRYFAQIPIWFSTGICVTMLVPLALGITVILEPVYDFEVFSKHISKYRPQFLITASGLLDYLMFNNPKKSAYSYFKYLCIGGEYIAPCAEKKINKWLAENKNYTRLHRGYGMCECGGTVTASTYGCNVIGSVGIPTPHVTVSAFDLNTDKELTYDTRGEIRVLTPCRMLGYYKKPEATENYFHKDENGNIWACTGDMRYVTEDGCVYVCGRLNDSYLCNNGDTIFLFDIEHAILDLPEVRQCKAVVSEINGLRTHVCHIVLNPGEDNDTILKAIYTHCAQVLPANYMPHYFRFYDDALPVSPSGKLDVIKMQSLLDKIVEI